jgi:hypothetical protein
MKPITLLSATAMILLICGGWHESLRAGERSPATKTETAPSDYVAAFREAERQLATDSIPYLVFDLRKSRITIKLWGTVVKECSFQISSDTQTAREFRDAWIHSKKAARRVDRVHLFEAAESVGDQELSVVSEVTKARQDQIQRYVPQSMLIVLSDGMRIAVHTDIAGEKLSFWRNTWEKIWCFLSSLLGKKSLTLNLAAPDAMALYGVCLNHPASVLLIY